MKATIYPYPLFTSFLTSVFRVGFGLPYDLFYPPPPPPLPPAGPFIFQFQYSPHGDRFYFSCGAAALPTGSFLFPLPWFHLTSSSSKSSSSIHVVRRGHSFNI
eukprot:171644_1